MPVRYYFVDGAPFVPDACSFNANVWDSDLSRRPIGDQRRRSQEHGNDWVDGSGPPAGCCDTPFGTADAWHFGGEGQPTKMSCPWFPQFNAVIKLLLRFASTVVSPRRYRGLIRLNLRPASPVLSPRRYRALIPLALTPHSTVLSPRRYRALIPLTLTLDSTTRSAPFYRASIPLALRFQSQYHKVGPYQGLIALRLTPASRLFPGPRYHGLIALSLRPDSGTRSAPYYRGLIQLTLVPASSYSANTLVTGCAPCASAGTWAKWKMTVAGITGSGDCPSFNQTFELVWQGFGCTWLSTAVWPSTTFELCRISGGSSGSWSIFFHDHTFSLVASYDVTPWDCNGPNTATLSFSSACGGWPATLTLTPG